MTPEQFNELKRGDVVMHCSELRRTWVVYARREDHISLCATEEMLNPDNWKLVGEAVVEEDTPKFPIGTKVRHKSGGVTMVVHEIKGHCVTCGWMDHLNWWQRLRGRVTFYNSAVFHEDELEKGV